MRQFKLSRRFLLRGAAGAGVSLPWLEIMTAGRARAATAAPSRFLVCFVGLSTGRYNGEKFTPATLGPGYDLPLALAPLAGYGAVKDRIAVVSNLSIPVGGAGNIPPGGRPAKFHSSSLGPLLSGTRTDSATPRAGGPTSDQLVGEAFAARGASTRFQSLQLRVQAVGGGTAGGIMSYRRDPATGNTVPNPPIVSPKLLHETLFSGFAAQDPAQALQRQRVLAQRRSVIDLVRGEADRLNQRLGAADRQRLERHFDEIRALEQRLAMADPAARPAACQVLAPPGDDPAQTGLRQYSDEVKRAPLMGDLLHLAFACDLTRSASLMYTWVQCVMSCMPFVGVGSDLHELGHGAGDIDIQAQATAWFVDQFGRLVAKFRDTPDGDGSLLDHTAMALVFEGGSGFDPESNLQRSAHSTEKMGVLVAGGAGGLNRTPGRHIDGKGAHPASVLVSTMNAVGTSGGLGEIKDGLPELFA